MANTDFNGEPIVILTAEEAIYIYNKLYASYEIDTEIRQQIINKIIKILK